MLREPGVTRSITPKFSGGRGLAMRFLTDAPPARPTLLHQGWVSFLNPTYGATDLKFSIESQSPPSLAMTG